MTIVYYELDGKFLMEILTFKYWEWTLYDIPINECVWIVPGTEIDE